MGLTACLPSLRRIRIKTPKEVSLAEMLWMYSLGAKGREMQAFFFNRTLLEYNRFTIPC